MSLDKFYTCELSESDLTELRASWAWLLPREFELVVVSALGDAFIRCNDGKVLWLNTGTGELSEVGESEALFWASAQGDSGLNWFMPKLLTELYRAGKTRRDGECYTYAILPVFAEGKYEEWNFKAVPACDHFAMTGKIHREIGDLPDGSKVRIVVDPEI